MRVRGSWLVVVAVIIATLAVPGLRQLWDVLFHARAYYFVGLGGEPAPPGSQRDPLARYRLQAVDLAQQAPRDPELLQGAGLIAEDREAGLKLLREAAQKSTSATAKATHAIRLMTTLPNHASLAESGGDPSDPKSVAANEEWVRKDQAQGVPEKLQPEDIAPMMQALGEWAKVDPENALPPALEARCLAATGDYGAALARWEEAARRPKVDIYWHEAGAAVARTLVRLGMPEPEAIQAAMMGDYGGNMAVYAQLRQGSRVAQWEGGLAMMQGRNAEAVRWWRATSDLGRALQVSGETYIGYLVGVAVEGIGASPTWKWYQGANVGLEKAPLMGGAIFYGRHHDFYVKQVGEAEDAQLRDRLVKAKAQTIAARAYTENTFFQTLLRLNLGWVMPLELTLVAVFGALVFLIVYLAGRPWRRDGAEEATRLGWPGSVLLALVAVAPLTAGLVYAGSLKDPLIQDTAKAWQAITAGAFFSLLAAIVLPAVAAKYTRAVGYGFGAAWLGNHRRILPAVIAATALLHLGLGLKSAQARQVWAQEWYQGKHDEMALMKQTLGMAWEHPTIPPGSWYAEYPVVREEQPPSGAGGGRSPATRSRVSSGARAG